MRFQKLIFIFFFMLIVVVPQSFSFNFTAEYDAAQQKFDTYGELYFSFSIPAGRASLLDQLTTDISIDKVDGSIVHAYANRAQFNRFVGYNLEFTVLRNPGDCPVEMAASVSELRSNWNKYPSYTQYIQMMEAFASSYPTLCKIYEIGTSVKGRRIICAKISDNVANDDPEPRFEYSATMHGDEVCGYVLMLHFIEYLLSGYATDTEIKKLLDQVEIFINPLANPDGTYKTSDNSIQGAVRENANNVDLNRDYPPPGTASYDQEYSSAQKETKNEMDFYKKYEFCMGANFHGGAELYNYPWDMWKSSVKKHADDAWWKYVCQKVATLCSVTITNGGDWYVAQGTRQDWLNYYAQCRDVTQELSTEKVLAASSLPAYWDKYRSAFMAYVQESLYGIHGVVKADGQPVKAKISIQRHDTLKSYVYSKLPNGDFHRPIAAGTYDVTVTADGFSPKTFEKVLVENGKTTTLNVEFGKTDVHTPGTIENLARSGLITINNQTLRLRQFPWCGRSLTISLYQPNGKVVKSVRILTITVVQDLSWNLEEKPVCGFYVIRITDDNNRMLFSSTVLVH
ncbi:MAG: carboxypeptidase regulatory-like domain-containing protein [Chitinivibrionales bacterium]|nr:carboxypeptidase regulatory-like domain-containing protein [Chitinivibrionales bacterium]